MGNNGYKVSLFKHSVICESPNLEITQPIPNTKETLKMFLSKFNVEYHDEIGIPNNQEEMSNILATFGIEHEYFNADLFETKIIKDKEGNYVRVLKNEINSKN